ncbi:TonB-dependent receptor plug domain-containing protein [Aquisalimonas asiatica]|uniref:Outer membrane receptor for ferrienterochelin and colicins n=1 Tax=Aquisalimonas asiatica TaxID=406100 RepID=A0A1H8SXT0_9GAMM|nr:TonB-dependent receptor [Aquisalimonas asiatica]SEO83134.1 outer membrane receptor for ferrienterochelin and colicins [Aquisalimonas asiatica]
MRHRPGILPPMVAGSLLLGLVSGVQAGDASNTPAIHAIEPMVVTATRSAIRREEAPSGYTEITREDVERKPATSLADLLQDVPGLAVDNEQDGRSQIRIRGFEPSQTLILINGRRINNTDELIGHSDFRLTQIPTSAIERIEVVRGPLSTLYGSDALGGVVNVIVQPPDDEWTGRVQARVGATDPRPGGEERNLSLYTAGPLGENTGALLSLDVLDRNGSLNPDDEGVDEIEGREAITGYGSVFHRPAPGHEIEVFFNGVDDRRRARRGEDDTRRLDIFRYSTGARYDLEAGPWDARADVYRSRSTTEALHLDREEEHTDDIIDLSATRYWGQGQQLTVGADFRRESFWREREGEREFDDTVNHRGALLQNRSDLLDERLIVTFGARADDHTQYSGEISPSAGVVYSLTDTTRLKADYGRGFSAPDLRRSSGTYDFRFTTIPLRIIGNQDLEPERSDSFSLGLEHDDGRREYGFTVFRNNIKDLIDTRCIENCDGGSMDDPEVREYQNVDRARTQGVELNAGYRFDQGVLLRANYTYLHAEDRGTGERLEGRPRQRFNLLTEAVAWRGATAHVRTEYIGSQRRGDDRTRDYTLLHLGLNQELAQGLSVRAGIDNVTDQRLADIDDAYTNEIRGRFYHTSVNWEF